MALITQDVHIRYLSRRHWLLAGLTGLPFTALQAQSQAASPPTNDWPTGSASSQGLPDAPVAEVLAAGESVRGLRSLLLVRRGVLVAERYYRGALADDLQPINSVTKSVSSLLVGLSLHSGKLPSLERTVGQCLPEAVAAQPRAPVNQVTLAQILTGMAGLQYDYRFQYQALAGAADPVAFAQGLTASAAGGWVYNDATVGLLSPILARIHGQNLDALATEGLWAPLGIGRVEWPRDRSGLPTAYAGLRMRPRDALKLAWLMANAGRWGEAQVVPAAWVQESQRSLATPDWGVAPVEKTGYGYLWFTGRMHGHAVVWGWGYGAQLALAVPSLQLAVVTTAVAPPPQALPAQNHAVMGLVGRLVAIAAAA